MNGIQPGIALLYGIHPVRPLRGFPEGKAKIKMGAKEAVQVFIKLPNNGGIRKFLVNNKWGKWRPVFEIKANYRKDS